MATTSNLVDFFQNAFEAPNYIDAGSLTIQYKWFFNTIGVIGFFLSVYAFASILLTTGFFGTLLAKKESDIYVPAAPKGVKGNVIYWVFLALGGLLPATFMIPLEQWIGAHKGADFATRSLFGTKIWPQGLTLEQGMWTGAAGLLGLAFFAIGYFLVSKKNGVKPADWNFGVDFRFISYVIKWPSSGSLLIALRFIPLVAVFYFANALCQNLCNMVAGRKEWLNTLLMCLTNIIGLVCIWVYQYSGLISKGVVRLDSARVMLTWPLFINLTVCTIISRRFYKKTGKVYIGALMNTILFTVIGCANTMTLHCTNWWF